MWPVYSYIQPTHAFSIAVVICTHYQLSFGCWEPCLNVTEIIPAENVSWFDTLWEEQKRVCGMGQNSNCQDEFEFDNYHSTCCGFCDCRPSCKLHGTCCLSAYDNFTHGKIGTEANLYGCVNSQYIDQGVSIYNTDEYYWLVTKCSKESLTESEIALCENPEHAGTIDGIVPVSDPRSASHYRNKYCAFCNGVAKHAPLTKWKLKIYNQHYLAFPNDRLLATLREQKGNIIFIPPSYLVIENCYWPPYYISTCNITGFWNVYDEKIELACHAFIDPFNQTFQNYFCYLCNTAEYQWPSDYWTCHQFAPLDFTDLSPPFFALLDVSVVNGDEDEDTLVCESDQFIDYKNMVCRDIMCHGGKLHNGRCVGSHFKLNVTCISIFYKCTPLDKYYIDELNIYLRNDIENGFIEMIPDITQLIVEFRVFVKKDDGGIIEYLVVNILINTALGIGVSGSLDSLFLLDTYILTLNSAFENKLSFKVRINFNILSNNTDSEIYVNGTINKLDLIHRSYLMGANCSEPQTTELHRLQVCPYVALNTSAISMHLTNRHLFIHDETSTSMEPRIISKWDFKVTGTELHLCLDTFIKMFNYTMPYSHQISNPSPNDTHVDAKQLVSLFCVCCSLFSLLITIMTYLRFRELHSQPGINNLLLCMFLLCAQTTYQFGAGQRSLSDIVCSVVGAICHFLWLTVIFSMNICSIHMFKIFRKDIQMQPTFSWRSTFWYIVYICTSSLIFVSINLSVSFAADNSSGYGGKICFISSNLMQIITFIIPSATALLSNIALFSFVVFKISNASIASEQMNIKRNYLIIYARLSTLTGVTWIFGFINLLVRHDVMEYLFIVFNASQGVFIMIAFVFNKRVCSLFCTEPKSIGSVHIDTDEFKIKTITFNK